MWRLCAARPREQVWPAFFASGRPRRRTRPGAVGTAPGARGLGGGGAPGLMAELALWPTGGAAVQGGLEFPRATAILPV